VWADFQNLDAAFQRSSLRAAFLQLPRHAVAHLVRSQELRAASENVVFLAVASWLRARAREAAAMGEGPGAEASAAAAADALQLLRLVKFPHMSANFLTAVASHEQLLRLHPDYQTFLLEATQYSMAPAQQRAAMHVSADASAVKPGQTQRPVAARCCLHAREDPRFSPRPHPKALLPHHPQSQADPRCSRLMPRSPLPESACQSAFTSHFARDDLHTAISKFRASDCKDAYYLLTEVRGCLGPGCGVGFLGGFGGCECVGVWVGGWVGGWVLVCVGVGACVQMFCLTVCMSE